MRSQTRIGNEANLAVLEHLAAPVGLPVSIGGWLDMDADMKGTLEPFAFLTSGTGTANDLAVNQLKIGTLRFRWEGDADRIHLNDVRARLYGGELSGSGVLPLQDRCLVRSMLRSTTST